MKDDKILLKSSFWYTVGNFLTRTIVFIATPIYIQFLTKSEYGIYSNFVSWMTIFSVLTGMNLQVSIMKSRYEFEDEIDGYLKTSYAVVFAFISVLLLVYFINPPYFKDFLKMDNIQIGLLFLYLYLYPAYNIYTAKYRAYFDIRSYMRATFVYLTSTVVASIALMLVMKENRLTALIMGQTIPVALLGFFFLLKIFITEGKIRKHLVQSALQIGVPMIPHLLGVVILNKSDRIMLTNLVGSVDTAYYSVGGNVVAILAVISNSLNNAFVPWLTGKLAEDNDRSEIKKNTNLQVLLYSIMVAGMLLIGPEIVFFFGGKSYAPARAALVPLLLGTVFQHVYILYMNLEFYKKKTTGIAIGTTVAALLNIVLNYMFIPKHGFVAAAYTTFFSYLVLLMIHYFICRKLDMTKVYDNKFIFASLTILTVYGYFVEKIYDFILIRYIIVAIAGIIVLLIMYRKRELIRKLLQNRRKKKSEQK